MLDETRGGCPFGWHAFFRRYSCIFSRNSHICTSQADQHAQGLAGDWCHLMFGRVFKCAVIRCDLLCDGCRYDKEGEPSYASSRLWDDGVLDPADTRRVLGLAFEAACNALHPPSRFGVFRM